MLNGRRLLVIGASGFLGRRLVAALVSAGADVLGIDERPARFPVGPAVEEPGAGPPEVRGRGGSGKRSLRSLPMACASTPPAIGKLRLPLPPTVCPEGEEVCTPPAQDQGPGTYRHITGVYAEARPEAEQFLAEAPPDRRGVFHLAGLADAGLCQSNPRAAYLANVALVFDVLESCRAVGQVALVFPSTGLVYTDGSERPHCEDDPVCARSAYTGTKLAAEMLIAAYAHTSLSRAIIVRLGNVYGADADAATVVGTILGQVARRAPIAVRDRTPVRDFLFVADAIEAFLRLFLSVRQKGATIVNVSTGRGTSIRELAALACELFSLPGENPPAEPSPGGQRSCLVLANDKLKRLTGWAPPTGLREGLEICGKERADVRG